MKKIALSFILFGVLYFLESFTINFTNSNKPIPKNISILLTKHTCITCHNPYKRVVGPSFLSISKKKYNAEKIAALIANPQPTDWREFPPMNPIKNVPFEDVKKIAKWINSLE